MADFIPSSCAFQEPRTDAISWGNNRGGCFVCEESLEGEWMTEQTLYDACAQMCSSDPSCVAYEASLSPLDPVSQYRLGGNCCLEYDAVDATSLYAERGTDNDCQREAFCWIRAERDFSEACNSEFISPNPMCRQIYEWFDEDLPFQLDWFRNGCSASVVFASESLAVQNIYQTLLDTATDSCIAIANDETSGSSGPLPSCPFDEPRTDGINWGYNKGGCFVCEESVEGEWLTDDDLYAACEQTCASDPDCIAFEASMTPLDALSQFRGSANCCLSHNLADESSPVYIESGSSSDNCEKEANCWIRVDKSIDKTCDSNLIDPHPKCRRTYEWDDADLVPQIDFVNGGCIQVGFSSADQNIYDTLMDSASTACLAIRGDGETNAPTDSPQRPANPPTPTGTTTPITSNATRSTTSPMTILLTFLMYFGRSRQ